MLVVGGGLAGCEAAWQLAERGVDVLLRESKPEFMSAAHSTPFLAEIVCSNSLRSDAVDSPAGLLKAELRRAGSLILACADATRVPAGEALAVDRYAFARLVTTRIAQHPRIRLERRVVDELPCGDAIVATGPLTGGRLARQLGELCGRPLYFYDAIAPIVDAETIDRAIAFRASRWGKDSKASAGDEAAADGAASGDGGEDQSGDYLNCPLDREEYAAFVAAVRAGRQVAPHSFEEVRYFEGCLPIEVMADRGLDVLAFGPMRPVGLTDPRTGKRPHAVVQLRPETRHLSAYNLVGFQTRLAYPEQQRIFRMIPGLGGAEFLRMGSIHRNSYVDSPRLLGRELELRTQPTIRLAGQITGVEGYIESTAMGLLAGRFAAARARGAVAAPPPPESAMGALHTHVTRPRAAKEPFEPMNINFGLLPPLTSRAPKRERRRLYAERAVAAFGAWVG
ncbi:MAG TPA: methylenetetrahydrofolate--tRNA-(uracil(54)-C(5))-methyltransferase (FADH(2)-oxidizing) TrmFO [Polyangia bacterium]|jgi:methylenetetrahydrofolate--tRNA-(uracil-5-)-methyltransferase|nr:methylenetetrahydrofolate--tRNA-(uracil(54)-C(5))-methyltransferase (FADH(2)-oxidizing) TrmFO [Polyangia bacterium]